MNSTVASSITFVSIFAAALIGMAVRRVLPEDHVGTQFEDELRPIDAAFGGFKTDQFNNAFLFKKRPTPEVSFLIFKIRNGQTLYAVWAHLGFWRHNQKVIR